MHALFKILASRRLIIEGAIVVRKDITTYKAWQAEYIYQGQPIF